MMMVNMAVVVVAMLVVKMAVKMISCKGSGSGTTPPTTSVQIREVLAHQAQAQHRSTQCNARVVAVVKH